MDRHGYVDEMVDLRDSNTDTEHLAPRKIECCGYLSIIHDYQEGVPWRHDIGGAFEDDFEVRYCDNLIRLTHDLSLNIPLSCEFTRISPWSTTFLSILKTFSKEFIIMLLNDVSTRKSMLLFPS